ncbi:lymphocyte antigen 6H-like isoform X1 [Saccopteryx leptura]|uniref:lymphocyte antigen 6H-like isoform X1 n=1 Tax=Saccopteryx leptura TaxID=249018 RepID=UPI00339BBC9E
MEGHSSPCRLPEHRRADTLEMEKTRHDTLPSSSHSSRAFSRSAWNMLPEIMKGLGLVLLAALLCSEPADGLWCQFCTAITNFSHCTARECLPTEKVCASVRITDLKHSSMPVSAAHLSSSDRKDYSVSKMCASSCNFLKRQFFSDYLMLFINFGILKVDVECCDKDFCNWES